MSNDCNFHFLLLSLLVIFTCAVAGQPRRGDSESSGMISFKCCSMVPSGVAGRKRDTGCPVSCCLLVLISWVPKLSLPMRTTCNETQNPSSSATTSDSIQLRCFGDSNIVRRACLATKLPSLSFMSYQIRSKLAGSCFHGPLSIIDGTVLIIVLCYCGAFYLVL